MYQLGDYNDYLTVSNKVYVSSYVSSLFKPAWNYNISWGYDVLASSPDGRVLINNFISPIENLESINIKRDIYKYVCSDPASRDRVYHIQREVKNHMRKKLWP